jgi:formylglycine-generating enzyme
MRLRGHKTREDGSKPRSARVRVGLVRDIPRAMRSNGLVPRTIFTIGLTFVGWVAIGAAKQDDAEARGASCPPAMSRVEHVVAGSTVSYCIDRYEGALVEHTASGDKPFSPYEMVHGRDVRAVSRHGVVPQAYISRNEADVACKASHKRLCTEDEWTTACRGKRPTAFPYGEDRRAGYCNDSGTSPLATYYADAGEDAHGFAAMNDPRLNALHGTVATTGQFTHCRSSWGPFDMVGNVHEWIDDPAGTFLGGYYLDTHINGDGCAYKTVAHDADYHDYSTGFRCCAETRP